MSNSEKLFLAGMAAFSASLVWGSLSMKFSGPMTFGPGFLPRVAGLTLLALIGLAALRKKRSKHSGLALPVDDSDGAEDAGEGNENGGLPRGVLITVVILAVCITVIPHLGVLGPIFLAMLAISWWVSGHAIVLSATVSAATLLIIYLIFSVWLGLPVL